MNITIRVAIILALALFSAYAQAAARSPEETHLARLAGTWQVIGRIGEEQVSYAATASYSVTRKFLRVDLGAAPRAQPSLTWIVGFDAHRDTFVCFEIDAASRTRGPFVTTFTDARDGGFNVELRRDVEDAATTARVSLRRVA